jgi:hypothetical protein
LTKEKEEMLNNIIDLVRDLRSVADVENAEKAAEMLASIGKRDSIIARARDMVCVFPVLFSTAIEPESLTNALRALEVEYASLVRTVVMADNVIDLNGPNSAKKDLVKRFHQNTTVGSRPAAIAGAIAMAAEALAPGMFVEQTGDALDRDHQAGFIVSESALPAKGDRKRVEFFPDSAAVLEACKEIMGMTARRLNAQSLNEVTVKSVKFVKDATDMYPISEDLTNVTRQLQAKDGPATERIDSSDIQFRQYASKERDSAFSMQDADRNYALKTRPEMSSKSDFADTFVKKYSALEPILLKMEVEYKTAERVSTTEIIIGIKVSPHPVESVEMVHYVGESIKHNSVIFRAIQWTTGEIKFWRDFIVTMDTLQRDAVLTARSGSASSAKWWGKLRGMAASSRFRNLLSKNKMLPNVTLMLSSMEVEGLAREHGVDLLKPAVVERLIAIFFLLRVVIMDDSSEAAQIYDESTRSWERYSYKAFTQASTRSEVKDIISLVNR